jgi:membrane-associated protease RseP (regulator of RpoE activity)
MNKEQKRFLLQVSLFIATFITTTLAGSFWVSQKLVFISYWEVNGDFTWDDFVSGMHFSVPFLFILTVHEFGHYFMARYHKVKATLPFYIPLPPYPIFLFGTMGAVIRLLTPVPSKKQNFDIGIAGPIAGFFMALVVLFYGFYNLPPAEHIYTFHPEYEKYGLDYADHVYQKTAKGMDIAFGKNLLFLLFENFVDDPKRVPNPHEIMHYPYLLAGYISLVFTFLNLIPIGQLDGGHVLYGLAGFKKHRIIASVFFIGFMFYAGLGVINPAWPPNELIGWSVVYVGALYLSFTGLRLSKRDTLMYAILMFAVQFLVTKLFPGIEGYYGWLLFGLIIGKFIGVEHPPCQIEEPLDTKRIVLGWFALVIFILCFSPAPIVIT